MLGLMTYMPGKHLFFQKCVVEEFIDDKLKWNIFFLHRNPFQGQMGSSDIKIRLSK